MSKKPRKKKVVKRQPVKNSYKKINLPGFLADFVNFKTRTSQDLIEKEKAILELRKESTGLATYIGAIIDLIADSIDMPSQVLMERFLFYCDDRRIVDKDNNTKGKILTTKYGF
jgi:hypothetical protein